MVQLLFPSLFLSLFGIFTVFGIHPNLVPGQIVYLSLGLLVFFIVKKVGSNIFHLNIRSIYWAFIAILLLTFFIGLEVKGSKRWIDFYFYRFQASEFFKIFFILFMADFLSRKHFKFEHFSYFLKSFIYFIIPTFIIFKQPDLGNALVFAVIYAAMILFSHFPKRYLFSTILVLVLLLPFSWIFLKNYQKNRIMSFVNPHVDTQGTSYNMIQAVITVGSGNLLGKGLGLGTQSRLYFLPENYTDFAFSSLVEQFGFVGGALVLICFGVIFYFMVTRMLKYYYRSDQQSKRNFLFSVGFIAYLLFQVVVNISMNMGLVPIAGIALPFISYGGSSVLALLIGFALIP